MIMPMNHSVQSQPLLSQAHSCHSRMPFIADTMDETLDIAGFTRSEVMRSDQQRIGSIARQ